ncbi:hypothetical protein PHYPSEUDO_004677 [Phytophthora pseudosyringae]|uniref:Uncharacterized protein n=1 Tax=Phytophthora pseudosyringae TaxID=221518 RepID=A0A8T1VP11_9STRA|nr:hypothetical protein PHYPSEUDO_004677 [Phytophthora pseudosyringae]
MVYLDKLAVDEINQAVAAKKAQRNAKDQFRGTAQGPSSSLSVPDPTNTTDDPERPAEASMEFQVQETTSASTTAVSNVSASVRAENNTATSTSNSTAVTSTVEESALQEQRNLTTAFGEVASNSKTQQLSSTSPHIDDEDVSAEEVSAEETSSNLESVESDEPSDINVTKPQDTIESYGALDSDRVNDDGFENDEEMLEFNAPDELEGEEETVTRDVPFAEALFAAVGGMEGLRRELVKTTSRRRSMSA